MPLDWGKPVRRAAPANEEGPKTMHVTMLETRSVSPDGIRILVAEAGDTIELTDGLAQRLIDRGVASPAKHSAPAAAPAGKTKEPAATDPTGDDVKATLAELPLETLQAIAAALELKLEDDHTTVDDYTAAILPADADNEHLIRVAFAIKENDDDGNADPAENPIEGMNAKNAVAAIAKLTVEQLDAIPEDPRKGVNDAITARRAKLAAGDTTSEGK